MGQLLSNMYPVLFVTSRKSDPQDLAMPRASAILQDLSVTRHVATVFSEFLSLPAELRYMIWEFGLSSRYQVISDGKAGRPIRSKLLGINKESRATALKHTAHIMVVKKNGETEFEEFDQIPESRYDDYEFHLYFCDTRRVVMGSVSSHPFFTEKRFYHGTLPLAMALKIYRNKTYKQSSVRRGGCGYRISAESSITVTNCLVPLFENCILRHSLHSTTWCDNRQFHSTIVPRDARWGDVFERMRTILVQPYHPRDRSKALNQEVVELDWHSRAAHVLCGTNRQFILDLRDARQVEMVTTTLRWETSYIASDIQLMVWRLKQYRYFGGRLSWWEMVVAGAQRLWLDHNYLKLPVAAAPEVTSYRVMDSQSHPEPGGWDPKDPWIKKTLARMPELKPAVVMVLGVPKHYGLRTNQWRP
jgi:hypothetical protein